MKHKMKIDSDKEKKIQKDVRSNIPVCKRLDVIY